MKLFINNKRIKFVDKSESIEQKKYDILIDSADHIDLNKISGNVLISNCTLEKITPFFKILESKKSLNVKSISFLVNNKSVFEKSFKKQYKIIEAAGGIVLKNDLLLLIHRLGMWDLPKGKLDAGESTKKACVREVEEECGVQAEIMYKICATWHTYTDKDKKILKKTTWFLMNCLDDINMQPQVEENIDKIEWMEHDEAKSILNKSYSSIAYVMKKYGKMAKIST